jgi:hypothetical protein
MKSNHNFNPQDFYGFKIVIKIIKFYNCQNILRKFLYFTVTDGSISL